MSGKVALFAGDGTFDLTLHVPHVPQPDEKVHVHAATESADGVIANAAVACAMAGQPARAMIQAGADEAGARVLTELAARGVDVGASIHAGENSSVVILIEPQDEKRLFLYPGTSLYPSLAQTQTISLNNVGWMHTAIYDLKACATLTARCRAENVPWSIDLEPASFMDGIETLAALLDGAAVVLCNARAAQAIGQDAVTRLFALGVRAVVLTEGSVGATWCECDGRHSLATPCVVPVDTTGAGDCLAGWLVAGLMTGLLRHLALAEAVIAASLSCTRPGAQLFYPTRPSLNRFKGNL